jgi:hypothetical protein
MRKYRFARFLAWLLIVGGLVGAVVFTIFGVIQLLTPAGIAFLGPALGLALGGVVVSLVGFGFLAFFDIAEVFTADPDNASNYSLKRTDQSLRD